MPPGGFAIVEQLDQLVTYADGYKTKMDLRLPDPAKHTPPATGWPCILLVHGASSSRSSVGWRAKTLARIGYVTIAYDVRGQGDTYALNPGRGMQPGVTAPDMAEIFHAAEKALGTKLDFARLGVTGGSQGGYHSWTAAAWSEHKMPAARGTITHFPKVLAVCPEVYSPKNPATDQPVASGPGITRIYKNVAALTYDPSYRKAVLQAFLKQDPKAFGSFGGQAAQNWLWLGATTVPAFARNAWNDQQVVAKTLVDAINHMPATTPRLALVSTGNHGTPDNVLEKAWTHALQERWFDHFLKGIADELPKWPRFQIAVQPDIVADFVNKASVWESRQSATFPATGQTTDTTFYPRQAGLLSGSAPTGVETADRIAHKVSASYTPQVWLSTGNTPKAVFAGVPLSTVVYRSAPLASDRELLGRARVSLNLDSLAPNLQVHTFLAEEDAAGKKRYITGGFRALRARKAGAELVDIELDDTAYVFRKGHRLLLVVENHVWHRPQGISILWTAPYFESYTFDIRHSSGAISKLVLPFKDPGLSCRATQVSLSRRTGGTLALSVSGSPGRAGDLYLVLASASGTLPGFALPPVHVPINFDSLSQVGLLMPGFVGLLDARGKAAPQATIAAGIVPSTWVGLPISFAALGFPTSGAPSVSAVSQVRITH